MENRGGFSLPSRLSPGINAEVSVAERASDGRDCGSGLETEEVFWRVLGVGFLS
jgi:hypothetical protein